MKKTKNRKVYLCLSRSKSFFFKKYFSSVYSSETDNLSHKHILFFHIRFMSDAFNVLYVCMCMVFYRLFFFVHLFQFQLSLRILPWLKKTNWKFLCWCMNVRHICADCVKTWWWKFNLVSSIHNMLDQMLNEKKNLTTHTSEMGLEKKNRLMQKAMKWAHIFEITYD